MSECSKRQRQELNTSKVNLKDTEAKSNCLLADNSKHEQRILHDLPIHPFILFVQQLILLIQMVTVCKSRC